MSKPSWSSSRPSRRSGGRPGRARWISARASAAGASYATLKRRLPASAKESWRHKLAAACAAHPGLGPASLVLYDVSTLYFEAGQGDGFRGWSRRSRSGCSPTPLGLTDAHIADIFVRVDRYGRPPGV
jgi:hypothetical protein